MQPNFGCGLKAQIYENLNESTITVLKDLIRRAVIFYEPRVVLEAIETDHSYIYEGRLNIELIYRIVTTNTRHNLVYPFYFREGTDVQE